MEITDHVEIANNLNEHFNTIGTKMAGEIDDSPTADPTMHINRSPLCSIYLQPTTIQEIIKLINEIEMNKATGSDKISAYIIKITCEIIAPIIT